MGDATEAPGAGAAVCERPAYMTFTELARQLGTRTDRLLEYVRRADDPLPVRLLPNRGRGGVVNVAEFDAWFARNAVPYGDR